MFPKVQYIIDTVHVHVALHGVQHITHFSRQLRLDVYVYSYVVRFSQRLEGEQRSCASRKKMDGISQEIKNGVPANKLLLHMLY